MPVTSAEPGRAGPAPPVEGTTTYPRSDSVRGCSLFDLKIRAEDADKSQAWLTPE